MKEYSYFPVGYSKQIFVPLTKSISFSEEDDDKAIAHMKDLVKDTPEYLNDRKVQGLELEGLEGVYDNIIIFK